MLQLSSATVHLHSNDLMHRDIKPENVLAHQVGDRWIYQFTDHGGATHTDRRMEGRQGTHFFCAPEILDGERYNEIADIFSLGVLFLEILTGHDPFSDHPLGKNVVPESSADIQTWMYQVDKLIEARCHWKYRPLLRGMLLRNTEKRWSASKCLAFLKWVSRKRADQASLMCLTLPWKTGPFTEAELERGNKREYGVFERDNVDCGDVDPDGLESDDASTIIAATAGTAGDECEDEVANLSRLGDINSNSGIGASESGTLFTNRDEITVHSAPPTPKASCQAGMPVTPRQGAVSEDGLVSVPCTPLLDDQKAPPNPERLATNEAEPVYDFTKCDGGWDWGSSSNKRQRRNERYLRPPARERPGARYRNKNEAASRPPKAPHSLGLLPGIFKWDLRDQIGSARETTPPAKAFTKTNTNRLKTPKSPEFPKLLPSELPDTLSPKNYVSLPDALFRQALAVSLAPSETSTQIHDKERQAEGPPVGNSIAASEAPTKIQCEEQRPDTEALRTVDQRETQPVAPASFSLPVFLPKLRRRGPGKKRIGNVKDISSNFSLAMDKKWGIIR